MLVEFVATLRSCTWIRPTRKSAQTRAIFSYNRTCVVNRPIRDRELPSILHFSSEDQMTKWQICQMFADIMGLPLDNMVPLKPEEEPKDGTIRPYDCHLDTSELQKLGIDVSTVDFKTWW